MTGDLTVYDPACSLCMVGVPHTHPAGEPPVWPCIHCHNAEHGHCDPVRQWCSCDCGLRRLAAVNRHKRNEDS